MPDAPRQDRRFDATPRDGWLLAGIALLGLAVRLVALESRPLLGGDEAHWGVVARTFLRHGGDPFGAGYLGFPAFGEFVTAGALALAGDTISGLRSPAVVSGALTAIPVGIYALHAWGRIAGVTAALVVAVTLVHVHLSRQGLPNIIDALFAAVALFALEAGWRERRRALFVIAGLALGWAQYFYATARLAPLIVLVFVGLRFAANAGQAWSYRGHVAAMLFTFAVAALPEMLRAFADPGAWIAPFARRSDIGVLVDGLRADMVGGAAILARRAALAASALVSVRLRGLMVPASPLLEPVYAVAFVVGIIALVRRAADPRSQLLLLWIAGVVAVATLSESTPAGQRYALAIPACAVVAGVGAATIVGAISHFARGFRHTATLCILAVAAAFVAQALVSMRAYFSDPHRWVSTFREPTTELAEDLVTRIRATPPGTRVVMLGAPIVWYHGLGQLAFLAPATRGFDVDADDAVASVATATCAGGDGPGEPDPVDCLIVVLPHRAHALAALREQLRIRADTPVLARDGTPLYTLLAVCARCTVQNRAPARGASPAPADTR
ncbi:MAG TPA: glycosyltransferase family 39 protein [Casimicrobiaceae bacterium]|nr:glycosyltransferase family 39 protein [Casimicrobiaceae bacterium]